MSVRPSRTRTQRSSRVASRASSAPPPTRPQPNPVSRPSFTLTSSGQLVSSRSVAGELRSAVIQPATRSKYKKYLHWFFDFCHECGIPPPSNAIHMDTLMSEYMEWLYASDYARSSATGAYYGLLHFYPQFKHSLPISEMTITGWERLHPGQSYPPLTWNLTVLIAFHISSQGNFAAALAVLLSFDCYLRINECVHLQVSDVALPNDPRLGVSQPWTAIKLSHTKTGKNQFVTVTRPAVGALLAAYVAARPSPSGPLFPFTDSNLRSAFLSACSALDLYRLGFTPHSLRHGAATHDCLLGLSVEDIMRKGRWASSKSARLYIQSGRSLLLGLDVPASTDAKGKMLAANLLLWFRQ